MKKKFGQSKDVRKALSFERTLHRWKSWLASIQEGRSTLTSSNFKPSLEEMETTSTKALLHLEFPKSTNMELYWLCCVLVDYQEKGGYRFENLVLPEWFPREYTYTPGTYNFRGHRIYPPVLWDEDDHEFWFMRDPFTRMESREQRAESFPKFPNRYGAIVLNPEHPVRKYMRRGRPSGSTKDGITYLD